MSRYRGPRCRLTRKLGKLPGLTPPTPFIRPTTPGQHGKLPRVFKKKLSAYGLRLIEKQKMRFNYHLTERQLIQYVNKAKKSAEATGDVLLNLLEMRLDNVVYRLGMAPTIVAARQLVTHGHILVNKKKVDIPSYNCKTKETISIRENLNSKKLVRKNLRMRNPKWRPPRHLTLSRKNLMGIIKKSAGRGSVQLEINELLVIEFYSRN